MTGLSGTPWVDRNLSLAWERVASASPFGAAGMPLVESYGKRNTVVVEEYGCGHYGCVMPTNQPGVVFKLSSDETEAYFIAAAMQLGFDYETEGIVQYYGVYRIANAFHYKRPLYAIWREEAFDLGFPLQSRREQLSAEFYGAARRTKSDYEYRRDKELMRHLQAFLLHADKARKTLQRAEKAGADPIETASAALALQNEVWGEVWWDRWPASRAWSDPTPIKMDHARRRDRVYTTARELRACAIIAEMMANTDGSDLIGRVLGYYLEEGLLLADVHANNVGKVEREGYTQRVITDPGHAVPLIERWREVVIEEV